jgi:hypothetical protein
MGQMWAKTSEIIPFLTEGKNSEILRSPLTEGKNPELAPLDLAERKNPEMVSLGLIGVKTTMGTVGPRTTFIQGLELRPT